MTSGDRAIRTWDPSGARRKGGSEARDGPGVRIETQAKGQKGMWGVVVIEEDARCVLVTDRRRHPPRPWNFRRSLLSLKGGGCPSGRWGRPLSRVLPSPTTSGLRRFGDVGKKPRTDGLRG